MLRAHMHNGPSAIQAPGYHSCEPKDLPLIYLSCYSRDNRDEHRLILGWNVSNIDAIVMDLPEQCYSQEQQLCGLF